MTALSALWSSAKGALWSWLGVLSAIAVTIIIYALVRGWAEEHPPPLHFLSWLGEDNLFLLENGGIVFFLKVNVLHRILEKKTAKLQIIHQPSLRGSILTVEGHLLG